MDSNQINEIDGPRFVLDGIMCIVMAGLLAIPLRATITYFFFIVFGLFQMFLVLLAVLIVVWIIAILTYIQWERLLK